MPAEQNQPKKPGTQSSLEYCKTANQKQFSKIAEFVMVRSSATYDFRAIRVGGHSIREMREFWKRSLYLVGWLKNGA